MSQTPSDVRAPSGNPTSACASCHRRKLKCDRVAEGCYNCVKAQVACLYPPRERAPRRKRGPYFKDRTKREQELKQTLKTLEVKLEKLTNHLESHGMHISENTEGDGDWKADPKQPKTLLLNPEEDSFERATRGSSVVSIDNGELDPRLSSTAIRNDQRLLPKNRFWSNFTAEIHDMEELVQESEDDDECHHSSGSSGSSGYSSVTTDSYNPDLIFGSDPRMDTHDIYPSSSELLEYWHIYMADVDPVTKILHVPTFGRQLIEVKDNLQSLDAGMQALVLSICFAAVTSMSPTQVQTRLGESKDARLQRFKTAIEKALMRANFLNLPSIISLQALIIYLICLRPHDDSIAAWRLISLAMRIAHAMNLHVDGSKLNVSPFEVEMRRRLWWNIRTFEHRCAEEHGLDPSAVKYTSNTKLPLNINDTDLDPEAVELPEPRTGCTDMTFCLVTFEIILSIPWINHPPGGMGTHAGFECNALIEEKENMVEECHHRLQLKYIQFCDSSRRLDWMTSMFTNLALAKIRLMVYHPFDRAAPQVLPEAMKSRSLLSAIEVIEYSNLLTNESWASKWAWTFRNQVQWHAMAYVLADLCRPGRNDLVERAWRALDDAFRGLDGQLEKCKKGALWHSIRKLRTRAESLRVVSQSQLTPSFPSPRADNKTCPTAWNFDSSNDVWGQTVLGPNFYNHPPPSSSSATAAAAVAAAVAAATDILPTTVHLSRTPVYSLSGATTPEIIDLDSFGDVVGPWTMVDDSALSVQFDPHVSAAGGAGFEGLGGVGIGLGFEGFSKEAWDGLMGGF